MSSRDDEGKVKIKPWAIDFPVDLKNKHNSGLLCNSAGGRAQSIRLGRALFLKAKTKPSPALSGGFLSTQFLQLVAVNLP